MPDARRTRSLVCRKSVESIRAGSHHRFAETVRHSLRNGLTARIPNFGKINIFAKGAGLVGQNIWRFFAGARRAKKDTVLLSQLFANAARAPAWRD
jgi:hypothetical protein